MKLKIDISEIVKYASEKYPEIKVDDIQSYCMSNLKRYLHNGLDLITMFIWLGRKNSNEWSTIPTKYGKDIKPVFDELKDIVVRETYNVIYDLVNTDGLLFAEEDNFIIDGDIYELEFHLTHNAKYARILEVDITNEWLKVHNNLKKFQDIVLFSSFSKNYISQVILDRFCLKVPSYKDAELTELKSRTKLTTLGQDKQISLIKQSFIDESTIVDKLIENEDFRNADHIRFIVVKTGIVTTETVKLYCVACKLVDEPVLDHDLNYKLLAERN